MQTGTTIPLIVKRSDTILSVKDKIHEREGIPPDDHLLMYGGKELDNGRTLSDYKIEEESKIYSVEMKGNNYYDIVLQMLIQKYLQGRWLRG